MIEGNKGPVKFGRSKRSRRFCEGCRMQSILLYREKVSTRCWSGLYKAYKGFFQHATFIIYKNQGVPVWKQFEQHCRRHLFFKFYHFVRGIFLCRNENSKLSDSRHAWLCSSSAKLPNRISTKGLELFILNFYRTSEPAKR